MTAYPFDIVYKSQQNQIWNYSADTWYIGQLFQVDIDDVTHRHVLRTDERTNRTLFHTVEEQINKFLRLK